MTRELKTVLSTVVLGWFTSVLSLGYYVSTTQRVEMEKTNQILAELDRREPYVGQADKLQAQVDMLLAREATRLEVSESSLKRLAEVERTAAVSNSLLARLDDTLVKLDSTMDSIGHMVARLDERVGALERGK